MLRSPMALKSLLDVETINPCIMVVMFDGNPMVTIISCYSSTNEADDETASDFYDQLSGLLRQIPRHNMKIIAGDMNAKIGSDKYKGYCFHNATNRNSKLLLDLLNECDLRELNTFSEERRNSGYLCIQVESEHSKIIFLLAENGRREWNCEADNSKQPLKSDHRQITARIGLF